MKEQNDKVVLQVNRTQELLARHEQDASKLAQVQEERQESAKQDDLVDSHTNDDTKELSVGCRRHRRFRL